MEKKVILIVCFLLSLIFISRAQAQSADLATAIIGEEIAGEEFDKKKQEEQVADDRGIFSFLNFSFIKKPLSIFSLKSEEKEQDSENKTQNQENAGDEKARPETPLERAIRLAEGGDDEIALSLGYMYLYGQDGVDSDYAKAFHFYELAANDGNTIALNNLGSLYFNGIGTEVNYKKAAELFSKAAQNGSDDAAVNLGFIYLSTGKPKFFDQAITLFEQAAKSGNNTAKFMLGYAYYKGFVVEKDYHKAVELIKEAATAKFDEAEFVFANIYANGNGIAKNYGNAVKYYRSAVGQGHVESMMRLADILKEGKMFPQNPVQAHILYNIASVYGATEAAEKRDSLEKVLKLEQLLEAQAVAENYKENPSELTQYIRQTFGKNVCRYIDDNLNKKD